MDAKPDDTRLKEALLLNRAACNLELRACHHLLFHPSSVTWDIRIENYGSVLRDCAAVIVTNPRASKAYYRAGLALLALERVDEALDVCVRAEEGVGVGVNDDAGFRAMRERAEKKREEVRRKEEERRERTRRAGDEKQRMAVAFAVRVLPSLPFTFPAFLTTLS
jgi:hypothetical protein